MANILIALIGKFTAHPLIRNVLTVATGTAVAQVINIAFSPIITRLYGPEAYGLQGLFMSVLGLLTTVAALGYPTAIVLPRTDVDALGIARISIYIGFTTTTAVALLLSQFGSELLTLFNAESIAPLIYLIPAAMMITVLGSVLGQWLIRKKAFKVSATYGIASAFLTSSIKTVAGFISPSALLLITTNTLGVLIGTILTYWGWQRTKNPAQKIESIARHTPKGLWRLAKQHADFPFLRTPQNLINGLSQSIPVLMLSSLFGAASAGQYTIAIAVLGIPTSLFASSVVAVFYPRVTEAIYNSENARTLIVKATLGMAAIGFLPSLAILAAGPFLFEFVFGNEWRTAGTYAQLLAVWFFFQFINTPAVSAVPALRLQGGLLIYELVSTGTKLLALWLGFFVFESDIAAIAFFSFFGVLAYVWLILWVIHRSGQRQMNLTIELN